MGPDRTMIDVLRKGNQELFHSAMLEWLLDPSRADEHGMNRRFLEGFASLLAQRGKTALADALAAATTVKVAAEVRRGKSRYDVVLTVEDTSSRNTCKVVVENKTKSVGGSAQLGRYLEDCDILVALGWCDVSFDPCGGNGIVQLDYSDVLDLLSQPPGPAADARFGLLVTEYQRYLERELGLLNAMDEFCRGEPDTVGDSFAHYVEQVKPLYNDNDRRFLNLVLLKRFIAEHGKELFTDSSDWHTDKQRSGAWAATRANATPCEFARPLQELIDEEQHYGFWFHVELNPGVFAENWDDPAGNIQLRCCGPEGENRTALERLKNTAAGLLGPTDSFNKAVGNKYKSFYVVRRPLRKRQLRFDILVEEVRGFAAQFATIRSIR